MTVVQEIINREPERWASCQKYLEATYQKGNRIGPPPVCNVDIRLFMKWAYRVEKGWYGFSMGDVPYYWGDIISQFLSWVETQCPDFKIHQIKLKFGGLRFYIDTATKDEVINKKVDAEISALENHLCHANLIY